MEPRTIVPREGAEEREVTPSLLLQSHRTPRSDLREGWQIAEDPPTLENSPGPLGCSIENAHDAESPYMANNSHNYHVEQTDSNAKRFSAYSGETETVTLTDGALLPICSGDARKSRGECDVTKVDASKMKQAVQYTSIGSKNVGVHSTGRNRSSSEKTKGNPREKFRVYWQCALNNFGLTNEGMLLKQDACEQGFCSADAQEVMSLMMRCTVDAVLKEESKPEVSASASLQKADQSGTREKHDNLTGAEDVDSLSGGDETDLLPSTKKNPDDTRCPECRQLANIRLENCGNEHGNVLLRRNLGSHLAVTPHFDTVLELGAGIGRLTRLLQEFAAQVVAVDFVDEYVKANRDAHGSCHSRKNDLFVVADATTIEFPLATNDQRVFTTGLPHKTESPSTFDLIIINWLLMYLTDDEVKTLLRKLVSAWSRRGGFVFLRESCGEPSDKGKQSRNWALWGNPTVYRRAEVYTRWIHEASQETGTAVQMVLSAHPMTLYQQANHTDSQCCWFLRIQR
ncbi:methyltransferase domain-containing protein [Toxoplasma gondii GAB2-2007-GAL-DOM2]|uniref:phosphoethanolamine N-methyltransferase n=2 Tax=Toxoplasma gondii TaxID=5811 RepID=A0A086KRS6_TOXGO|nr:methyltransferase domain-containing protein [Toxoplasma gondii GAB2-2007-GAL-DOM2]KFG47094.1 methyltransferase domain-containing protein [Toxoplasma gondii FOU]